MIAICIRFYKDSIENFSDCEEKIAIDIWNWKGNSFRMLQRNANLLNKFGIGIETQLVPLPDIPDSNGIVVMSLF